MKKFSVVFTIVLLTASITPASDAANVKAGGSCLKINAVSKLGKQTLICIKSGKKFIWQIKKIPVPASTQAPIPAPTPSATPAPTPAPTPTPTPTSTPTPIKKYAVIPISLPIKTDGAITFENILDHINEIPSTSYNRIQAVIKSNDPVIVKNNVFVGPTTQIYIDGGLGRIQEVLARTAQLWSGFSQPNFYSIYIYNGADEKIAEDKFTSDFKAKGYISQNPEDLAGPIRALAGNCQNTNSPGSFSGSVGECRGANSGAYNNSDDSYLQLGQSDLSKNDPNTKDAIVIGHEYSHSVTQAQWINNPNCVYSATGPGCNRNAKSNHDFSPCWLYEGLPQANGAAAAELTFNSYMSWRNNIPYGWGPTTVTDYSASSIKDYLYNQSNTTCYQNGSLYLLGYSVGALTTEALIAIGGPQATMALFSQGSQGLDFATAFQNVYGISWESASTILSKVIAAEYATFGPAPK